MEILRFSPPKRGENSDMINLLASFPHGLAAEDSIHLNAAGYQRLWGHPSLQTAMECTIEHSVSSAPHRTSLGALLFAFGLALNGSERNNSPWESLVAHKQGWNCCSLSCFTRNEHWRFYICWKQGWWSPCELFSFHTLAVWKHAELSVLQQSFLLAGFCHFCYGLVYRALCLAVCLLLRMALRCSVA